MKEKVYEFDQIFKALGDKHRLQILNMLLEKERNAGEILEAVDVVQSTLSHHMKSLSESGLVKVRKSGKWTYYSVSQEAIQAAYDFLKQYLDGENAEDAGAVKVKTVFAAAETGTKNEKAEEGKKAGKVPKDQKAQKSEKDTVMSHQSANSEDIFASAEAKKDKKSSKKEHDDVFQASSVKEKSAEKDGASKKKKGGKSKKEKKKKDKK